ncbi:Phospholipase_D-nuclease N-terminal [Quadrisphaera granulorum]|uniref:Phospholipase D-like protein n=1 Tax=Quadrisphaera granulorum TaxID=317664 RepID=A0A316A5P9_9ACTN|nr:PLD nuclease N-terminal domain-containing protein [Quadrisphaera granulorum]PWJ45097.1 phospholipase D-like protein [Quadrisphaera granulorum]SZE99205.1 Phospholipase_D-nuclease N-terminal [Quadrisphaera granulorum]
MLVALVALVLGIYALVDCLRTTDTQARGLPLPIWVAVIVLLPVVGPLAWLLAGRTHTGHASSPTGSTRGWAPKGPDDDEDFLRSLDRKHRGDV